MEWCGVVASSTFTPPHDKTIKLEIISQKSANDDAGRKGVQIVLVHGSYHGAWCWKDTFMPYLSARGFDVCALSLRGHGTSTVPVDEETGERAKVAGSLQTHADDVRTFLESLGDDKQVVVVGHSFGGLIVQQVLADQSTNGGPSNVVGAVLACSVPPSGNQAMVGRIFKAAPWLSVKITYAMITDAFKKDANLMQDIFFRGPGSLPDTESLRILERLQEVQIRMLDVAALPNDLPVKTPKSAASGNWPPVLVLGAEQDSIVDSDGLRETADAFCTAPLTLAGIGHDVMLDAGWETAAEATADFITKRTV